VMGVHRSWILQRTTTDTPRSSGRSVRDQPVRSEPLVIPWRQVVARAVGGAAIELGAGSPNRLNPLDEGPRPPAIADEAWALLVASRRRALLGSLVESALTHPMTAVEHTALDQVLRAVVVGAGTPTLPMVVDALFNPSLAADGATIPQLIVDGREVGHALRRWYPATWPASSTASRHSDFRPVTADDLPGPVAHLQRGEGLWRVGQRAFVVSHTVSDGDLKLFDTNSRMMQTLIIANTVPVPCWRELGTATSGSGLGQD